MLIRNVVLVLAALLAACGGHDEGSDDAPVATDVAMRPPERASGLEAQLRAVPPEQREALQGAMACENARRTTGGEPRLLPNAATLRTVRERLAKDPSIAKC